MATTGKSIGRQKRLELIAEAIRYCQKVKELGMPPSCYSKALREPIHFLWERYPGTDTQCRKEHSAKHRSKAAEGMKFGKSGLVYDHAIPFIYLQNKLLSLDITTELEKIASILDDFGTIVLITKEENKRLEEEGFRDKMPDGWPPVGGDPLARYKKIEIEIIENASYVHSGIA